MGRSRIGKPVAPLDVRLVIGGFVHARDAYRHDDFELARLHRFDWSGAMLLPVFILAAFRFSRLIYKRLGD